MTKIAIGVSALASAVGALSCLGVIPRLITQFPNILRPERRLPCDLIPKPFHGRASLELCLVL